MEFGSKYVYQGTTEDEEIYVEELKKTVSSQVKQNYAVNDDAQTCLLDILDTAGQEEYSAMRDQYMRTGQCFLLIFSITSRSSFDEAHMLVEFCRRVKDTDDIPMVVVGNKVDLDYDRQVSYEEAEQFAKSQGLSYIETSAKTAHNVQEAFFNVVRITPRVGKEYKIVLLGGGGVGKSALTIQFTSNHFVSEYDPTIEDSYRKQVVIAGLREAVQPKAAKKEEKKKKGGLFSFFSRSNSNSNNNNNNNINNDKSNVSMKEKPIGPKMKVKKADANVLLCKFGTLSEEQPFMTGDPIHCSSCSAVFSSISKLSKSKKDSDSYNWRCEFCNKLNKNVMIDPDELPPKGQIISEFLLEGKNENNDGDEGVVIFCIDISGSMGVTTPVPDLQGVWKNLRSNNNNKKVPNELQEDNSNQYLPGENRNTQYISRLECMKAAINTHIDRICVEHPNYKVVLITFNNSVEIHGNSKLTIEGDNLFQYNSITKSVETYDWRTVQSISESNQTIREQTKNLEEGGATALGPALAASVHLCESAKGRKEVIVCTDGIPNVGIGSLDEDSSQDQGKEFYSMISKHAKSAGVTINFIAIEGCECSLEGFKECAEFTSGELTTLHPLELVRQIRKISQNPTVAVDVKLTILLHPSLEFEGGANKLEEQIGTVTQTFDRTYRFSVKSSALSQKLPTCPFQYQIDYRKLDGSRCLRVLSTAKETSTDREEVEKSVNAAVVGLSAIQEVAQISETGGFKDARLKLHAIHKLLERGSVSDAQQEEYANFVDQSESLENELIKCDKLNKKKLNDESVQVFYQMKKADISKFSGGENKREIIAKRKGREELNKKYYDYRYE